MAEADPISFHRSFEDRELTDIIERAHIMRSKVLDAFAKLETEIHELSCSLGVKSETSLPLGNRLATLRAAAIPDKKRKTRLDGLLDEAANLSAIRANIVHASISLALDLTENKLLIQYRTVPFEKAMNFSISQEDFPRLPRKVLELKNHFKQFRQAPVPIPPAATSATA